MLGAGVRLPLRGYATLMRGESLTCRKRSLNKSGS